jgi:radical SAM superfamily enzyme YgiQ (UPF0313 family)
MKHYTAHSGSIVRPRLLLINPAMAVNGLRLPNAGGMATMEPLALGYVAALTPEHWDVRIVDEVFEEIPEDNGWDRPDLVGLTSLSITVPRAYEIARRYRQMGVPVVMGGVHATLLPEEVVRYVDVAFQGEAEGKWPRLIRDFEAGRLQPHYNGGATALRDLPWPRRELYRRRYFMRLVSASRGCRYRCEFCTLWKLEGGRYRARPQSEVIAELEATSSRRPILFTDENVFTDRDWALGLFGTMAAMGHNRAYAVQASLNIADDSEMLSALKRSGCMTVLIGFESLNEESLRVMRKGVNLGIGVKQYREKIEKLHDQGLATSGTFMFGNDGDGPDVFERTVDFVLESGLDLAHFGLLTPNPGTDLFDRLAREGRLLYTDFPADYARYDLQTAVFRPEGMTPEQLEQGVVWATEAVSSWSVACRRAWGTLRATGNLLMAAIALGWNRTGLHHRVAK